MRALSDDVNKGSMSVCHVAMVVATCAPRDSSGGAGGPSQGLRSNINVIFGMFGCVSMRICSVRSQASQPPTNSGARNSGGWNDTIAITPPGATDWCIVRRHPATP
eukprot:m.71167 g.71167  ORF g.71167 m.71167 type:complete len:106 (-) comp10054_c0_seq2:3760-4077(-)